MNPTPFLRRPGVRTLLGILIWIGLYLLTLRAAGPASEAWTVAFDLGVFLLTAAAALALLSQFVLPVQSLQERAKAFQRLLDYTLGNRGPVLFLREGRAVESRGERDRRGAGVLLADQTSAGVLRTETRYTRAVGPGVTFTDPGERLASALDLRRQVRVVQGTTPGEEQPAGGRDISSTALTEDGIPVAADLRVTFMLDPGHASPPREGQFPHLPPYEFNPRAAERAVYGHAHREDQATRWTDLPLLVAVDLWREEIKRWRLEALLAGGGARPSPLEKVEAAIESRLVPTPDSARSRERGDTPREFEVLRRRGIRVLDLEIANLKVPEPVRAEHLRRWREQWDSAVEEGVLQARGRGQEARWQGEREGQRTLLREVTAGLRQALGEGHKPPARDTLVALLEDALQLLQQPELLPESGALSDHLRALLTEIRALDENCGEPGR